MTLWKALQPQAMQYARISVSADTLLMDMVWPPWFTAPLLAWLASLEWPQDYSAEGSHRGITFLELLVHFVVTARVLPPKKVDRHGGTQYVDLCRPQGQLLPCSLKEMLFHFARAIRAVSRDTGILQLRGAVHRTCHVQDRSSGEKGHSGQAQA